MKVSHIQKVFVILLICLQFRCATMGMIVVSGNPLSGTKGVIGTSIGFVGDIAIAIQIGGAGGIAYGVLTPLALLFILGISIIDRDMEGQIEYASYPNSPEGRALRKFIDNARQTELFVELAADPNLRDRDTEILSETYIAFDSFGYFRLVDAYKREERLGLEHDRDLTNLRKNARSLGQNRGVELLLHMKLFPTVSGCGVELHTDPTCEVLQRLEPNKNCRLKTGFHFVKFPMEATLIHTETGKALKAEAKSVSAKFFSPHGDQTCPTRPDRLWKEAIQASAYKILPEISPRMKTMHFPRPITKDPNPEVQEKLRNGYEEMKGETPSFSKAMVEWQKADQIAGGKSEGALINLGIYYFIISDFEKALEYYKKAEALAGPHQNLVQELVRRTEAALKEEETLLPKP